VVLLDDNVSETAANAHHLSLVGYVFAFLVVAQK
jgi:hypothetical protein